MDNIFDQFAIVHELVRYVKWNDIHSFKRINCLCKEVCEREMQRRCTDITHGYMSIKKDENKSKVKRLRYSNNQFNELQSQMQYYNPRLVLLFTNKKGLQGIDDIVNRQCNRDGIICRLYSNRGCFGASESLMNITTSTRGGGVWWLSLPVDAKVCLVKNDNEIMDSTKIFLVFNSSVSTNIYTTNVFNDEETILNNPVLYCGGLVRVIELYNHDKGCFEKTEHISIAIGGDNLHVEYLVMDEEFSEAEIIRREFLALKTKTDSFASGKLIKHQCILVFSCYFRNSVKFKDEGNKTEYELLLEYFPGIPVQGVFCEGEIFHVREGLLRLVKSLEASDIDGVTSIYVVLTWTM